MMAALKSSAAVVLEQAGRHNTPGMSRCTTQTHPCMLAASEARHATSRGMSSGSPCRRCISALAVPRAA